MLPFNFVEQKNQNYYHNLKIFIMGTDVTPWLTSDLNVSYSINGGINVASFTLSNQRDAFVLTKENLVDKKFRSLNPYSPSGEYSELAKFQIWSLKNAKDNGVSRNLQHDVKTYGPIVGSGSQVGGVLSDHKDDSKAQSSVTYRYPFAPRSLVFHKFDHVRIFAKNPLNISNNEWYCVFTGFLDQKPYTEDLVSGLSTIKISCQDIRYAMQRMRTQNNPAASIGNGNAAQFANGSSVKDSPKAGYFNDLVSQSFNINHVLGGLTFKESINFLVLGQSKGSRGGQQELSVGDSLSTGKKVSLNAVGEFKSGKEVIYNPAAEKRKEILESWNNLILFGSYSANPKFFTYAEMLLMGQETHEWGKHSVWKGEVHYLYPAGGSPTSNLVETSYSAGRVEDKVQWSTRLELLLDICENIDYVMYVSPLGDIIFEFPMWDFSPADYGPYESLYKFKNHIISRDINDEGGEAISALVVTSNHLLQEVQNPVQSGKVPGVAADIELVRTIYSNALASRIGVQVKSIYKPGIVNPDALSRLGMIEFAKATADYNKYSFKAQYRPFLSINRPIYDVGAYKIGHSNNVNYTWRLRDTVEVEIDMNFVRRGEIDSKGNVTFRFITGGEANPVSYNKIYTDSSIMTGNGVGSAAKDK